MNRKNKFWVLSSGGAHRRIARRLGLAFEVSLAFFLQNINVEQFTLNNSQARPEDDFSTRLYLGSTSEKLP
ncbi:hypothetical protein AVEN_185032-1 [Araneus ventricosus]|uniref:Uncharacterized protein n=1 Tax=Araneus ventricosus TaxID=182803 RepID=A0A4Y2BPS7_ARAVE|nr:hypothetical protein AVEN_185032-1 [Araneus ventricosus]